MGEADGVHKRRMFRWPKEARELVRQYKERTRRSQEHHDADRRTLVTTLAEISGNPRDACLRFLRELGVHQKRAYRAWTKPEQQRLLDLIAAMPVEEAAKILRRPAGSVRSMLHRLGMGGKTGREWFTKFSLSRALHTRPDEIQKWIDLGWLKSRSLTTAGTHANIIQADDFCQFVKEHGRAVASRRLTYEALWFVQNYVFPPSHAELLSLRGTYKKHDAGDEADPNAESQSAAVPKKTAGRKVKVRDVSSKGNLNRQAKRRTLPERKPGSREQPVRRYKRCACRRHEWPRGCEATFAGRAP